MFLYSFGVAAGIAIMIARQSLRSEIRPAIDGEKVAHRILSQT